MCEKLKELINSFLTRSNAFKITVITALFVFMVAAVFLTTLYLRILLGISFSIFVIIVRLVFGYVAHKEEQVKKARELAFLSLEDAILYIYKYLLKHLLKKELFICENTFLGYNEIIQNKTKNQKQLNSIENSGKGMV